MLGLTRSVQKLQNQYLELQARIAQILTALPQVQRVSLQTQLGQEHVTPNRLLPSTEIHVGSLGPSNSGKVQSGYRHANADI